MGYTNVFGGELLFPSQLSYLAITTAVDVTLVWPREQQIEGNNVVADFLDISTTAAALNVDFPDARNASTGNKSTVNNIGGNDFTVRDATGGVIQFVGTGEQWVIVLTDNSTEAGIWSAFQLGAATTLASASALAGAGLQADGFGMLEQIIDSDVEAATPITVVDGDRAKCLIYTAGAGQCDLPAAGTLANNWFFMLRNSGSGTLNIVPAAGNIDGSANLNLDPNGSTFIFTDGADYFTIGLTVASTIAFDFVSLAVPGSGDFVLSGANLDRISYRFTGALTGNRRIVVPSTTQQYWVDNQTSGAFTLEVVAGAAGQIIPQGESAIVYCDATNVINAVSSTSVTFPITIGQGGTSATNALDARNNLDAAYDQILINSGAGLSGGGDLTADRTLILDVNSASVAPTPVAGDFIVFEDIDDNLTYKAEIQDILDLASSDSLIDSGGNVRLFASTGGVAQLRSDGNSDTVPRMMTFTHQDGTVRGRVGWDSFSEEFVIQNLINANDAEIEINTANSNAAIIINTPSRGIKIGGSGGSQLDVRGSANNNAGVRWTTTAWASRAYIGFPTSDVFTYSNVPNGTHRWEGEDNITATVTMLELNPNTGCSLFFKGDGLVARTALLANGGFEVNNTLTGGGFERVLTTSDLDVESGTFDGALLGFTTSPVAATFSYARVNNLVTLTLESDHNATSNALFCTTTTGTMPASIRPAGGRYGYFQVRDNGIVTEGSYEITTGGQIRFSRFPEYIANSFTNSGSKGPQEFTITYNMNVS